VANEVQIVNIALSWLGQNQINALGDSQNEAKIMNANYATSRDKLLADHAWTFALRREILAPVAAPIEFGTAVKFLIPSDVLRVHRVFRPTGGGLSFIGNVIQTNVLQNARWEREGQFIVAREEIVWALFIFREVNTDRYSPSFVHALAARLAADTCMVFTENRKMFEQMEALFDTKLADALYSDGSQGRTEIVRSSRLTGIRTR
jgi:hypothetical protein